LIVNQPIDCLIVKQPIHRLIVNQPIDRLIVNQPIDRLIVNQPIDCRGLNHLLNILLTYFLPYLLNYLYRFFESLLERHGPLNPDDKLIGDELEAFPTVAQMIISQAGGIHKFLGESLKFSVVDGYVCLLRDSVRTKSMAHARRLEIMRSRRVAGSSKPVGGTKPAAPITKGPAAMAPEGMCIVPHRIGMKQTAVSGMNAYGTARAPLNSANTNGVTKTQVCQALQCCSLGFI